jgi:flagellar biosynthetic protein FlhB
MAEDNKTERATPKKQREARERGEVARSTEISAGANIIAGLIASTALLRFLYDQTSVFFEKIGRQMRDLPQDPAGWETLLNQTLFTITWMMLPVAGVILLVTLAANYLQVGFKVTTQPLTPKLEKLNPINGFQRLFSGRAWVELFKSALKIGAMGFIVWGSLRSSMPELIVHSASGLGSNLVVAGKVIWDVIWKLSLFLVGVGVLDYAWQRYDFGRKQRMTKQEIRDEFRQTEGDVYVKSARRAKHRKLAQTRLAAEVAKADVVTTNPTHYAVALKYSQFSMRAPKVVAKGQRWWARLIKGIALRHGIPVIENKPVTRALYHGVEVGQEIPPSLYRAVAEILAVLYKMKARKVTKP